MPNILNRADARKAIYGLLVGKLPTASVIIDHQPASFSEGDPLVYVTSSGTMRPPLTGQGTRNSFYVNIHTVVLFSDEATGHTNDEAEDYLDKLEMEIAQAVERERRREGYWQDLHQVERSLAEDVIPVAGKQYFHEIIPFEMVVF